MRTIGLGFVILSGIVAFTSVSIAQTEIPEHSRGQLADGETERAVGGSELGPGSMRMIPLLKVDPGKVRGLPLGDPAALESGFGTITRRADGKVGQSGPSKRVLDVLRKGGANVSPNANENPVDPIFADDEEARAIVGMDNRIRIRNSRSYPFRTFGLLWNGVGSCSATLIAPRTVVTAAHCVYDHEDGGWKNEATFYPGANGQGNYPYGKYEYDEMTILSGFINNYEGYYGSVVPWDLAVVTLQRGAGDRVGWLGTSENQAIDFRAYNVGYPGDKPFATMWRDKCDVNSEEIHDTEYVHRCDTAPGSSGSSMYTYTKSGSEELRYVEGINVAESDQNDTSINYNIGVLFTGPYFEWVKSLRR